MSRVTVKFELQVTVPSQINGGDVLHGVTVSKFSAIPETGPTFTEEEIEKALVKFDKHIEPIRKMLVVNLKSYNNRGHIE